MPEYLAPGVYVEEVPSAVKPIAGVSTSTAGFIAVVPDSVQLPGPIKGSGSPPKFASVAVTPAAANEVKLVTSWSDFVKYFGDLIGGGQPGTPTPVRSEEHTSEIQSRLQLVFPLFLLKKKKKNTIRV